MSPRRCDAVGKQRQALDKRIEGKPFALIAYELGYADESGARKAVQTALKKEVPSETREQVRRFENARLEKLLRLLWEHVNKVQTVISVPVAVVEGEPLPPGALPVEAKVVEAKLLNLNVVDRIVKVLKLKAAINGLDWTKLEVEGDVRNTIIDLVQRPAVQEAAERARNGGDGGLLEGPEDGSAEDGEG